MKVLFALGPFSRRGQGGDWVQATATAGALRRAGVEVVETYAVPNDLRGFDLVHLFNATRPQEAWVVAERFRSAGIPVCLSPIYWDLRFAAEVNAAFPPEPRARFRSFARKVSNRMQLWDAACRWEHSAAVAMERHGYEALQRDLLSRATLLLPNSRAELDLLHENFPGTRNIPAAIVPNGVERSMFARETPGNLPEASGARNPFVLCVGRIEPRKNQLNLVTALSETSLPVVMVGRISHRAYAEAVRRAMKASDRIIAAVDHARLVAFYRAAQVHAQPSFYETPGLASLEAAATGCPIVVTGRGSQREYFGDNAFYCDPFLPESINSAVLRAWNREPLQEDLRETIQQQYTWDVAAKRTCEAYQMILGQSRSGIHV